MRDDNGGLARIVEARDASPEELALGEVNSGIYVFDAATLWPALDRLTPQNAQGELYVTDTLGLLVGDGETCAVQLAEDPLETDGINTRVEFAAVTARLRDRINTEHMLAGVTIVDPATTWIDAGVEIEPDVVIHPFTMIRGEVRIATGVEIGPFASIRTLTELGPDAKVGTFVELKAASVGARTKIPHLSYIGDAEIGEDTNVAAGNVTANFSHVPGQPKKRTKIGEQRQDRSRQYVPRTCRDWGRHMDCAGNRHNGECASGLASRVCSASGHQGRVGVREAGNRDGD